MIRYRMIPRQDLAGANVQAGHVEEHADDEAARVRADEIGSIAMRIVDPGEIRSRAIAQAEHAMRQALAAKEAADHDQRARDQREWARARVRDLRSWRSLLRAQIALSYEIAIRERTRTRSIGGGDVS